MRIKDLTPEELHAQYKPWLIRMTGEFYLRYSTILERDEIYSVASLGLLKAAGFYEESRSEPGLTQPFMAFAKTVIRNEILDALNRQSRSKRVMIDGEEVYRNIYNMGHSTQILGSGFYEESSQEEHLVLKDLLRKAMVGAPPFAKRAFLAHFIRGETYTEIAEKLTASGHKCTRQAVCYHVERIRTRFKKLAEED
jgi:RNA polymerase sigma factor (sigma-70 family)